VGVTGNDVTNRSRPWDRVLQLLSCAPILSFSRQRFLISLQSFLWCCSILLYSF